MDEKVDIQSLKLPDELKKLNKEKIIFSKWVKKISHSGPLLNRLLIITDWEFFVLYQKRITKELVLSDSFTWFEIKKIVCRQSTLDEFTIYFKKDKQNVNQDPDKKVHTNFTFKYSKTPRLLRMFFKYLTAFHDPNDLPTFDYPPTFQTPQVTGSIPDYMRMKLRKQGFVLPQSTIQSISKFLLTQPTEFSFDDIRGILSTLPLFLEAIYLQPSITTLIVPLTLTHVDSMQILLDFMEINTTITEIVFKGPLPSTFKDFCDLFLEIDDQKITDLTFVDAQFSLEQINQLSKVIRKKVINSLQLRHSLGAFVANPFIQKFETSPEFRNFQVFYLSDVPSINIVKLLPFLKRVHHLSLVHCGFEIADFFETLQGPSFNFAMIDISQNQNNKQILQQFKFPKFLATFIMKDIEWDLSSMTNLFKSIMMHNPSVHDPSDPSLMLKIDMSSAKLSTSEWENFIKSISKISDTSNLMGLKWDNNMINKSFIQFLKNCKNLSILSLSGTVSRDDEALEPLIHYIADSDKLQYLSIAGTEKKILGRQLLAIVDSISINRSITVLDISNHKAGSTLVSKLTDCMQENRVVQEIYFGGNNIHNMKRFKHFFQTLTNNRGKPLYTDFPTSLVNHMLQYGKIKEEDVKAMRQNYQLMIRGNPRIKVPAYSILAEANEHEPLQFIRYSEKESDDDISNDINSQEEQAIRIEKVDQFIDSDEELTRLRKAESKARQNNNENDNNDEDQIPDTSPESKRSTKKRKAKKKKQKGKKKTHKRSESSQDEQNDSLSSDIEQSKPAKEEKQYSSRYGQVAAKISESETSSSEPKSSKIMTSDHAYSSRYGKSQLSHKNAYSSTSSDGERVPKGRTGKSGSNKSGPSSRYGKVQQRVQDYSSSDSVQNHPPRSVHTGHYSSRYGKVQQRVQDYSSSDSVQNHPPRSVHTGHYSSRYGKVQQRVQDYSSDSNQNPPRSVHTGHYSSRYGTIHSSAKQVSDSSSSSVDQPKSFKSAQNAYSSRYGTIHSSAKQVSDSSSSADQSPKSFRSGKSQYSSRYGKNQPIDDRTDSYNSDVNISDDPSFG